MRLHGARPWHLEERERAGFVATSVRLHGARPWHLAGERARFLSYERETPRRKAAASGRERARAGFVAASVRLHGARPRHLWMTGLIQ